MPGDHWIKKEVPEKWDFVSLQYCLRIFAACDIIGLGVCISQTGGSEKSFFDPFLFIVPTIVVLVESCEWTEIICWVLFALLIFFINLVPAGGFEIIDRHAHHVILTTVTGLCTSFPFLFVQTRTSIGGTPCPKCAGTGRISSGVD